MEAPRATGPADQRDAFNRLERRVAALPEPVRAMASAGLQKVVDFQDTAYGAAYLNRLDTALAGDGAAQGWAGPSRSRRQSISPTPWPMTTSSGSPI
jgi:indolepyruvate ferredoxin oxidoreductase beta subunit